MARTKGSLNKKTLAKMGMQSSMQIPVKIKPVVLTGEKRGRGRPKKEKTFNTIGTVTAEKETPKYIPEVYTTDIPKVERLNQLKGKYRGNFSGEDYSDAVNQAKKYMTEKGYHIINYFEQIAHHKSIIVGYDR